MIDIYFTKSFLKKVSKLDPNLQEDIYEKVHLFKNRENHNKLKKHKLAKPFIETYSFSVNYKIRILFQYQNHDDKSNKVFLITVGNHRQVYKK
jgi:mRNA-degrading endonuclease RelE of RelBE toxin-antitoxin system